MPDLSHISTRAQHADALIREGRAELLAAVRDGRGAGLSQRQIGRLVGRSQPEVGRLLREVDAARRPWMTAREAAAAIAAELARGDEDFALRLLVQADADLRGLREPGDVTEFLRRPRTTGDARWDTLLAGVVARACRHRGVAAPRWTRRTPLPVWWFPVTGGGVLAPRTMARTPIDLSRLGIWLDASAFQTA